MLIFTSLTLLSLKVLPRLPPRLPRLPPRLLDVAAHVLSLAESRSNQQQPPSFADVGCDHCLLLAALALNAAPTTKFSNLWGVDKSKKALNGGKLLVESLKYQDNNTIDLIAGEGLDPLLSSNFNVDIVSICGVGVPTMQSILQQDKLDRLNTNYVILQPQSSRRPFMESLYSHLWNLNFHPTFETMIFSNSRYYLTTTFSRSLSVSDKAPISRPNKIGSQFKNYTKFNDKWDTQISDQNKSRTINPLGFQT
ncbi:hypothetical protein ScalyP_jg4853 [Parmales sp. scaly parma]|nr:hypothetical protein ScalyP_jg4853 [Parmales sp. scaly parma]